MVRAPGRQPGGREFNSRRSRQARLAQRKSARPTRGRPEGQHLQRVRSSYGETEITADYGSAVGVRVPLCQYLPKGSDLSVHSADDLRAIETRLSNRPRKTLSRRTPAQAFTVPS